MSQAAYDSVLCHAPVSFRRAAAYLVVVLLAAWGLAGHAFHVDGTVLRDEHAVMSLELALVRAFCGAPSSYSSAVRVIPVVRNAIALRHVPLRTLIVQRASSLDEYCRQADQPVVNNENSLMLIESAILRMRPDLSLSGLGQALHVLRLAGLTVFVFLVLTLGGSLLLALGAMLCGLITLNAMSDFIYSAYPFLFVVVLVLASGYAFALRHDWPRRWPAAILACGGAGVFSALVANMRTSYLPVVAAFLVAFVTARWWLGGRPSRTHEGVLAVVILAAWVAGYGAFQIGLITRHVPADRTDGLSHSIAHPLVLALSVPETAFSRELGLRWDDAVGPQIALRIDPSVTYLSRGYHAALMQYYRTLWADQPGRMIGVYQTKFAVAGSDMLHVLRHSPGPTGLLLALLLAPMDWWSRAVWLVVTEAAIAAFGAFLFVRGRSVAAFALVLLSTAAALLQIEAGIIYSLFVQQYHNYSAFFVMFVSLAGLQALANRVARIVAPVATGQGS